MREDWIDATFEDMLAYEQPTKYIVNSTKYHDSYATPVLTAGKSFIKGYTNEKEGVFNELPVIIFDDFTTASQFVDFEFKVKSSAMKILKPTCNKVNIKFMFYCMQVNKIRSDTHKRYWISVYSKKQFRLPSSPEQRAIVSKIEALFSDLDNGITDLEKAQAQLNIYRQAVLKKAFEGELTKDWRERHADLPNADQLLEQIKIERETHYQKQLSEWEKVIIEWEKGGKKGKKPSKPKKLKKCDYLTNDELKQLPTIPSTSCWVRYSDICIEVRNGISKKPDGESSDEKILRISSVRALNLDLNDYRNIINDGELDGFYLQRHDLLFTRYNGSRDYVGVCAMFNGNEKYLFPDKLIRTRLLKHGLFPPFFAYAVNCFASRKYIVSKIRTTAGQSGISGSDIKSMPVPMCSFEEQVEIVRQIETRLTTCDKIEQSVAEGIAKSKALRQSILKKAIEGKLLTAEEIDGCKQASDYEPANELLKKIRAEAK